MKIIKPYRGVGVPGTQPGRTAIRMAFPNPFDRNTTVVLALAPSGGAGSRQDRVID